MASSSNSSPVQRSLPPLASTPAGSPEARRRRIPTPSVLSPLSTVAASSPAHSQPYSPAYSRAQSFRTQPGRQGTRSPPESISGQSLLQLAPSTRYRAFSAAASQAGSLATTTANTAGPTRFKRTHARKRPGQEQAPAAAAVKSANPDAVDLLALEDPDDVFRAFGVRDVRKLEQRASEAAAAKVAELRSMVGERYRDLLAAADSIVRMRNAADSLVDRIESADAGLAGADDSLDGSPSKRRHSLRSSVHASGPEPEQTLSSSAAVAHAVQLLLTIPSLVHAKLDQADFLDAARLEDLGQAVYRELSTYEVEGTDDSSDPSSRRRLAEVFPIIDRQGEPIKALGPSILRRALASLHDWEADPSAIAFTLGAIVMLRRTDPASALSTFLEARSQTLDDLLQTPSSSSHAQEADSSAIAERSFGVLSLVLRTVEAVYCVFGANSDQATTLGGVLQALKGDEQVHPALRPLVDAFPNPAALLRHLPPSFLSHRPDIHADGFDAQHIRTVVESWSHEATQRILRGFSAWISSLSGAKSLADLRQTGRRAFATAQSSSETSMATAHALQSHLERAIEARLAEVYRARLDALVARVKPSLESLLLALPDSAADRDPAVFLFESPLVFPSTSSYAPSRRAGGGGHHLPTHAHAHGGGEGSVVDPFESFLAKVGKRVDGRSPLVDRGVSELEDAAREIRDDLASWLGVGIEATVVAEDIEAREKLRGGYVVAAGKALVGVAEAIGQVLEDVEHDVGGSLFLGNVAFILSTSPTFVRDLLLSDGVRDHPVVVAAWNERLHEVQQASLAGWRAEAAEKASARLRDSMTLAVARSAEGTLWAWEAAHASSHQVNGAPAVAIPSTPSNATLAALEILTSAMRRVGPHRGSADPSIASSLLASFVAQVTEPAEAFAGRLEVADDVDSRLRSEIAARVSWDLSLVGHLVEGDPARELSALQDRFLSLGEPTLSKQRIESSVLDYLRRSQTLLGDLLPPALSEPLRAGATEQAGAKAKSTPALNRLLPLGPALSAFSALGDLHGASAGLVKPGPRLGLLPTRG